MNTELEALRAEVAKLKEDNQSDKVAMETLRQQAEDFKARAWHLKQERDALRAALTFYAGHNHYSTDDGLNWDSVSGEPMNILWHESEPWFIEDGSIARAALTAGGAQ
jgi:FtsZ-binding cell division protein ZapB